MGIIMARRIVMLIVIIPVSFVSVLIAVIEIMIASIAWLISGNFNEEIILWNPPNDWLFDTFMKWVKN